jgi:hypothetical protein
MRRWSQAAADLELSGEPRSLAKAATASVPPTVKFEIVSKSPTETVATAGDCLIVIVEKTVGNLGVNAIRRGFEQLEAQYEQVGYLSYIEGAQCRAMEAQTQQLLTDVIRRHTTRIGAAAMIVHGDGFRCTVVRSLLTGIHVASRAKHKLRVFSTVEPALVWYEETRPGRKLQRSALREALLALYPAAAEALR